MLLTKQQKYLLAVLEKLGCAEQRQLAALLQKAFAFSSLDDAMRVTNACVRQMQVGGLLQIADGIVSTNRRGSYHTADRSHCRNAGAVRGAAGGFLRRRSNISCSAFRLENPVSSSLSSCPAAIRCRSVKSDRTKRSLFCCLTASGQRHFHTPDPSFLPSGKKTAHTDSLPENNF